MSLESIDASHSPLQRETKRAVRLVAVFCAAVCMLVFLAYCLLHRDPESGNVWLTGLLVGLTLAMALLP